MASPYDPDGCEQTHQLRLTGLGRFPLHSAVDGVHELKSFGWRVLNDTIAHCVSLHTQPTETEPGRNP